MLLVKELSGCRSYLYKVLASTWLIGSSSFEQRVAVARKWFRRKYESRSVRLKKVVCLRVKVRLRTFTYFQFFNRFRNLSEKFYIPTTRSIGIRIFCFFLFFLYSKRISSSFHSRCNVIIERTLRTIELIHALIEHNAAL